MNKNFLPIGTVVMLKGGKKRLMITGFCMVDKNNNNKLYDYSGCLFPEGTVSSEEMAVFNHNQIEKIYYVGYSDDEEKAFKDKLVKYVSGLNSSNIDDVAPIGPGL